MPRADFLSGLAFLGVAAALIAEGIRLPGAGGMIEEGGEPGRVPIFLGLILAALALALVVRAVAQNGHRLRLSFTLDARRKGAVIRAAATAIGCTLYVALLGRKIGGVELNYVWLTFGFMYAFIVIAEWPLAPEIGARRWQTLEGRAPALAAQIGPRLSFLPPGRGSYLWLLATAAVQAALVAVIVAYVFEKQFFVQLP